MTWELEHATREAWAMAALLETRNMPDAAALATIRAQALEDALAMIGRAQAEEDEPAEEAAEAEEVAPPPALEHATRIPFATRLTPAREAYFRHAWGNPALSAAAILAGMNTLDAAAPPVKHVTDLYRLARQLGLPTKRAAPPAGDPIASFGLTPDEIEEAHRMLHGPGGGARKLAEWFGMELGRAQNLAEALRAQAKGQAA